jgi:iron-sulfur cluster repair protein YtfE (RIC family)
MDITQLILDEHAQQRNLFAQIEQIDAKDTAALASLWKRLRALLDSHAEAEEHFFYPRLMQIGKGANDADSAADETEDAIEDHNEIRDTAAAVDKEKVGTNAWFDAVGKCNKAKWRSHGGGRAAGPDRFPPQRVTGGAARPRRQVRDL